MFRCYSGDVDPTYRHIYPPGSTERNVSAQLRYAPQIRIGRITLRGKRLNANTHSCFGLGNNTRSCRCSNTASPGAVKLGEYAYSDWLTGRLLLLLAGSERARWIFIPSITASLLGMPFAAYPAGELNAFYDLTMYGSGLLNGALAALIHLPRS